MFSLGCIDLRAGIKIRGADGRVRAYSMAYFMGEWVAYAQMKATMMRDWAVPVAQDFCVKELKHPRDFWRASQSLVTGATRIGDIDLEDPAASYHFRIGGRVITCPHNTNCYVIDRRLLAEHSTDFPSAEISYPNIARFMLQGSAINHPELGKVAVNMINGAAFNASCTELEVLPVFLAATLLAEPRRNPATFLPSLMLLELIAQSRVSPSGMPFNWLNSVQNVQLLMQGKPAPEVDGPAMAAALAAGDMTAVAGVAAAAHSHWMHTTLYARMAGMPTVTDMDAGVKLELTPDQREELNASKRYNRRKNQKKAMPHEIGVQSGGYFPASHRFSYSELAAKRAEGKATLSDKKCFIIFCDFLLMLGVAEPVHRGYVGRVSDHYDTDRRFLREAVLPFLWRMQQCCYPSKQAADCTEGGIPTASFKQVWRDNFQRKLTSDTGLGLYPDMS